MEVVPMRYSPDETEDSATAMTFVVKRRLNIHDEGQQAYRQNTHLKKQRKRRKRLQKRPMKQQRQQLMKQKLHCH
jgi:hypothetical protein